MWGVGFLGVPMQNVGLVENQPVENTAPEQMMQRVATMNLRKSTMQVMGPWNWLIQREGDGNECEAN